MIHNANHYRFLLFKKLVENGLWNPETCFVQITLDNSDDYCYGNKVPYYSGVIGGAPVQAARSGAFAGLTVPQQVIAYVESVSEYHNKISVNLAIWGFWVKLSDNGMRGRAPNNVLGNGLRTILLQRTDATIWSSKLENLWASIRNNCDTQTFSSQIASLVPEEQIRGIISGNQTYLNGFLTHPTSESFWTDSANLTYRPLTDVIYSLKTKYESYYGHFIRAANIILANNNFAEILATISANRERLFREQYAEIEAQRAAAKAAELARYTAYEAKRKEEAIARAQKLKELSEQFAFFAPRRKEIAAKSVKTMEDFVSKISGGIEISTNTENPLIPSVSLDYANDVTLDLVCSKEGVFVESIKIPADKLIKFTQMLKGL